MITESEIDKCIALIESDQSKALELPESFQEYLASEIYSSLRKDEQQVLKFSLSVIYNCCDPEEDKFDIDSYLDLEDHNWSLRDKDRSLNDTLDAFFKNYSEEDLLAFVEDILVEDEDQELTTVGKEIILICSKSLIDLLQDVRF